MFLSNFKHLLCITAVVIISCSLHAQPRQTALIIGNSKYSSSPLKNPANDAADMSIVLRDLGYNVISAYDCERHTMRDVIRRFYNEIQKGGVGLFYYAGHGLQLKGENYLVPVDAKIYEEFEVEDQCVRLATVLSAMGNAKNKMNIVVLDACRNNPFSTGYRSAVRGLAKVDAPAGTFLAYATAPGSVALDSTVRGLSLKSESKELSQKNGLYTAKLLKYITAPQLSIEEVFKRVRIDVMTSTDNKQVPWESSSLLADYSFTGDREFSGSQQSLEYQPIETVSVGETPIGERRKYFNPKTQRYEVYEGRRFEQDGDTILDKLYDCTWLMINDEIFTVEKAKKYCKENHPEFRLPTEDELLGLMSKKLDNSEWGHINSDVFQEHPRSAKFWTSSQSIPLWPMSPKIYIDFEEGKSKSMNKNNNCAIILIKTN